MEKFSKFCDNSENKEKFIKVFQNLTRMTSIYLRDINQDVSLSFKYLSVLSKHARQLLNLTGTITEINEISNKINWDLKDNLNLNSITDIMIHIFRFLFYVFDNITLFSEYKILPFSYQTTKTIAGIFLFLVALIKFSLCLNEFYQLYKEKEKNEKALESNENISESQSKISNLNTNFILSFVKLSAKFGDLISTLNCSGVSYLLFGDKISDVLVSLGNIWSALVSIYTKMNLAKQKK
ncbi:MAG: PEX11 family protein [archaeon]|nr:PEX11 family protein [archaeon]